MGLTLKQETKLLKKRKIKAVLLVEDDNKSTPTGILFFQLFAILAELEHNRFSERTKTELEEANARGL